MKLSCLITCATLLFTVNMAPVISTAPSPALVQSTEEDSARAIDTQWYYRFYNGVYQKRLWSITQNKWLTDWIPA